MALEMSYTKYGLTTSKGYIVITSLSYFKGLNSPHIQVGDEKNTSAQIAIYASKEERDANGEPLDVMNVDFDMKLTSTAKNPLIQAYEHMKTLDMFKEAEDK